MSWTRRATSSSTTVHNLTYKDYMEKNTLTEDQKDVLEQLMSADTTALYGSGTIGAQVAQIINKKDLKPGDLIFYSYEENGRFRNISHVAIYVGDGKMVHAANPSRGVVLDPLRTGSVVFYARPYQ